jgi:hypothetical protein
MAKTIPLTRGKAAIVDDEDYESIAKYRWHANPGRNQHWRAERTCRQGKKKTVLMHRQIMDAPEGVEVDHKNRNPLDNRRCNLRLCTHSQNMRNMGRRKKFGSKTSQYKGVVKRARDSFWLARIRVAEISPESLHLGHFASEIEAAKAYDAAAQKYFGEFAVLNFPKERNVRSKAKRV